MKYTFSLGFLLTLSFVAGSMLTHERRTCRSVVEVVQMLSILCVMTFMSPIVVGMIFMFFATIWDGGTKSRTGMKEHDSPFMR